MKALLASAAIATLMLAVPAVAQQSDSSAAPNDQATTQTPDNGAASGQSGGTYGQMMRDNRQSAGIGPAAPNSSGSSTEMASRAPDSSASAPPSYQDQTSPPS